jgi:YfiH family protein
MKPGGFILNTDPDGVSVVEFRWLSFPPLQDFKFVSHGFTIKNKEKALSTQVTKNDLKRHLRKISSGKEQVIIPQQIHGNGCVTIKKTDKLKKKYRGDAILTNRRDIFLTISVADCIPIFLIEPKRKVIGLIHAGWRGTLLGIAKQAIRKAKKEFGCKPKDFTLLFGPAIQKCCYEISNGIAILFDEDCLTRIPGKQPKLDLIFANLKQFLNCGVKREKIFVAKDCTCCNKEMFHSFRRDKDEAGRMIAFLGIK